MSVRLEDVRSLLGQLALARRRMHDMTHELTLASLVYDHEMRYVHKVLTTSYTVLKGLYDEAIEAEADWQSLGAQEAGLGPDDHPGCGGRS